MRICLHAARTTESGNATAQSRRSASASRGTSRLRRHCRRVPSIRAFHSRRTSTSTSWLGSTTCVTAFPGRARSRRSRSRATSTAWRLCIGAAWSPFTRGATRRAKYSTRCTTWSRWRVVRRRWSTRTFTGTGSCRRSSRKYGSGWSGVTARGRACGSTSGCSSSWPSILWSVCGMCWSVCAASTSWTPTGSCVAWRSVPTVRRGIPRRKRWRDSVRR